jgi:hypothetical protein
MTVRARPCPAVPWRNDDAAETDDLKRLGAIDAHRDDEKTGRRQRPPTVVAQHHMPLLRPPLQLDPVGSERMVLVALKDGALNFRQRPRLHDLHCATH